MEGKNTTIDTIMGILNQFERKVIEAIQTDKQIDADPYDNLGQYKLIQNIKEQIRKELKVNP
jgi:hypothetical protein